MLALLLTLAFGEPVTLGSLLREIVDREELARLPDPPFTVRQCSSTDPAARSPAEHWFANDDFGHFLRTETIDGRSESVLLDAEGPGAVVRVWSATPAGLLRVYLDGERIPVIDEPMRELLTGAALVTPPLAEETARGATLYLPIPYARRCVITCDDPARVYYQVEYRTYAPGTPCTSFRRADLATHATALARAQRLLRAPPLPPPTGEPSFTFTLSTDVPGGALLAIAPDFLRGARAITELELRVESDGPLEEALRRLIVHGTFDGSETVTCPLGDLFGSAPGLNAHTSWFSTVSADATFVTRWVMPYRASFDLSIENRGVPGAHVAGSVRTIPWSWDERSLHFHARWRAEHMVSTRPMSDRRMLAIEGTGRFVGDMLSIANPVKTWWGEGDTKIYVDGEAFPSIFGTGTEDDYGYAWCSNQLFQHALHAQTRCDGPDNFGWTSVARYRALDAIPFQSSFRYDQELWHWRDVQVDRATTLFYYARPGARDDVPPITDGALAIRKLHDTVPRIPGALEAEELRIVRTSPGLAHEVQELDETDQTLLRVPGAWSGRRQLWVRAQSPGDFVELEVPVAAPGRRGVIVYLTESYDYGRVRFSIDGRTVGPPIDTFNTHFDGVLPPRGHALGEFELGPVAILRAEVVGSHPRSKPPGHYFGLDAIVLR